jgi:hypothetical protein
MKKKIEVSAVRQTADVEVIYVNANLISKAIRACIAMNSIIERMKAQGYIVPRYDAPEDENGNPITDERGIVKSTPVLDEKGNQIIDYCSGVDLNSYELRALNEDVAPFLNELNDAFEV